MPDLAQSLHGQDLGHLEIVAQLWGIELRATDAVNAVREICAAVDDSTWVKELIEALEPRARDALEALTRSDGRMPWAAFAREFGDVRQMGAARRDREKPYLKPTSSAEVLYYRALVARAFFETAGGSQEFAYVPDDLLPLIRRRLEPATEDAMKPLGRAATPAESSHHTAATDQVLDEAATRLAGRRAGLRLKPDAVLDGLLEAAGLTRNGLLQAANVKAFLEVPRQEAMRLLRAAWQSSSTFNELRLIPRLLCEGEWDNQALAARGFILRVMSALPVGAWWNLNSLVSDLKGRQPDFQRPAGDYDSWFIKNRDDGSYLRGFASWDQVDGALVRFAIVDVMHRLGMTDLGFPAKQAPVAAIRVVPVQELEKQSTRPEDGRLRVTSQGRVTVPAHVPRVVRYQVARFCQWEEERPPEFNYRITAASLDQAVRQGLKASQLLALLAQHTETQLPPALVKAIKRWEAHGVEARAESNVVLKVARPEIIKALRASKASRFLGEILGPKAVAIRPGAQAKVLSALAELGVLGTDATIAGEDAVPASGQSREKLTGRQ